MDICKGDFWKFKHGDFPRQEIVHIGFYPDDKPQNWYVVLSVEFFDMKLMVIPLEKLKQDFELVELPEIIMNGDPIVEIDKEGRVTIKQPILRRADSYELTINIPNEGKDHGK